MKRKKLQLLGNYRYYFMTNNEVNLMKWLTVYLCHCYDNEIEMHESFPLFACTKEDFNTFKVADASKATTPVKFERKPLSINNSLDPNHEESHQPFDLSAESSIVSINVVGRRLAVSYSVTDQHPKVHSVSPSST